MDIQTRDTITIKVLFFGPAADAANCREKEIALPAGATVQDAFDAVAADNSLLRGLENSIRFAVNQEYSLGGELLQNEDEIALIPPVSGG